MASRLDITRYVSIVVLVAACSSDSGNSTSQPASNTCGNGTLEAGEQCDFPLVPTCAQATGNTLTDGAVACVMCRINATNCRPGPVGGGGMSGGAGFNGMSGFSTNGGAATGGLTGQGGIIIGMTGGAPPFGGFPTTGGDTGAGGFISTGGDPGAGGFISTGGDPGTGGAVSTGGSTNTGPLGDVNALRQACADTINQYRAGMSLPPLGRASASVEACSDTGAQKDGTSGQAHGSAGDCPGMSAQNTCPGWNPNQYGGAENALKACLQAMWAEGEPPEGRDKCLSDYFAGNTACFLAHGHYLNMTSTSNSVVSCGFFVMSNGRLWMNQDFGR